MFLSDWQFKYLNYDPHHVAAKHGLIKAYRYLLSNSLYPKNKCRKTPLHLAAKYGQLTICQLILDNVDNKNPLRNDKWTPLHEVGKITYPKVTSSRLSQLVAHFPIFRLFMKTPFVSRALK